MQVHIEALTGFEKLLENEAIMVIIWAAPVARAGADHSPQAAAR